MKSLVVPLYHCWVTGGVPPAGLVEDRYTMLAVAGDMDRSPAVRLAGADSVIVAPVSDPEVSPIVIVPVFDP